MIQTKPLLAQEHEQNGFTLIEIVIVLVVLGILSAVAASKYFDMQEEAERKAALTAVHEAQTRVNTHFGQLILSGKTCAEARKSVIDLHTLADAEFSHGSDGKDHGAQFGNIMLRPGILTGQNSTAMYTDRLGALGAQIVLPLCSHSDAQANQQAQEAAIHNLLVDTTTDANIKEIRSVLEGSGAVETSAELGGKHREYFAALASALGYDINSCDIGLYKKDGNYHVYVINGKFPDIVAAGGNTQVLTDTLNQMATGKLGTGTFTVNGSKQSSLYAQIHAATYEFNQAGQLISSSAGHDTTLYAWIRNYGKSSSKQWIKLSNEAPK